MDAGAALHLCGGQVRETRTGVLLAHFTLSSAGAGLVCSISDPTRRTGLTERTDGNAGLLFMWAWTDAAATDVGAPVRSCARRHPRLACRG
jgi:hypothetical protein